MQCNCVNEIEQVFVERMHDELGTHVSVECQNETLVIDGNSVESVHSTTFKVTYVANGYTCTKNLPVLSKYCPHCGKKAVADTQTETAAEEIQA